ncbi:MAG: MiaB/RimO family radical SAM methylthiotransferase [Anaerolineaceae bacterium]|nr:MAG: MiaB/RimO family radical SAM methylthiotransferase [Anaerolineaceae bacterium]
MKIFFDSIGCRLNQSEIEIMAYQVIQAGHEPVGSPEACDVAVINTCSVTAAAASDSRSKIRGVHRKNREARIVLTGCWSELEHDAARALPGVVQVVTNSQKETLIPDVLRLPELETNWDILDRRSVPGIRRRTRAFIKVQDGCDNHCTYCLPTIARGASRSRPIRVIVAEIRSAVRGGVQEVVLTGSQLSAYGLDQPDGIDLTDLIRTILDQTEISRIRLSSMEPWGLPKELFVLLRDSRVCRQLHIPLQSGCDETLRRMGRPISTQSFANLVSEARDTVSGLAVTTDIMVGFPGETEKEFDLSLAFIEKMGFAGAHVFIYSPRRGTPAVHLPEHVPLQNARDRSRRVRNITGKSAQSFRTAFLGETLPVLWEKACPSESNRWELSGLTDNYIRVRSESREKLNNQISLVRLLELEGEKMRGELLV